MRNYYYEAKEKWREHKQWERNRDFVNEALRQRDHNRLLESQVRQDLEAFSRLSGQRDARAFSLAPEDFLFCLHDRTSYTGFDRHYIYHVAWAARILAQTKPNRHADFSSSLFFAAIASAFIPMQFFDYRPALLRLAGLDAAAVNLTALPFADNTFPSVSCMHVLEHVGLGRYGDPLDPLGDLAGIAELTRVTAVGGTLLVAVPAGRKRIAFNAHRIYAHEEFISFFSGMRLVESALVGDPDSGHELTANPASDVVDAQAYGCCCYRFEKI